MPKWIRVLLMVGTTLALSGCWAQPGATPERSAYNASPGGLDSTTASRLHLVWSRAFGGLAAVKPQVVTATDVVFVTGGSTVHSVSLATGSDRWTADTYGPEPFAGGSAGGVTVAGGTAFVPVSTVPRSSPVNGTHALDVQTGIDRGIVAPPNSEAVMVRGTKVVGGRLTSEGSGIQRAEVSVTDIADASQSWASTVDFDSVDVVTIPAVAADFFVVGSRSAVVAFPLTRPNCTPFGDGLFTCEPLWSVSLDGFARPPVLSADGTTAFVATTAGTLSALDTADGSPRWSAVVPGGVTAAPAVAHGSVYAPGGDGMLWVYAASGCGSATCGAEWSAAMGSVAVQPGVGGDVVYTGAANGIVRAFDAHGCGSGSCPALWSGTTGAPISGPPAIAFGHLVVGTLFGGLFAFTP